MSEYLAIIEKAVSNYSAYSPDLPGCVANGGTKDQVLQNMREAISLHLEGLREDGLPIPPPSSSADYIAI